MKFLTEKHLQDFSKDKFGYKLLSKKILDDILLKMESPNCFGLYGNWGSGKSTILNYIQQHIKNESDLYKGITTVYFEPWKYEYSDQNDLLFALLNCIKKESGVDKKIWKQLMTDILVIGSSLLRQSGIANLKDVTDDFAVFEDKAFKEHERWIDKIDDLRIEFEKIIAKVLSAKGSEKLIIFIDDLDRCLPENTVKLLEAMKNFLFVNNTIFVLAIDRRIISEMVEKKYGLHGGYGDEYLMKIIHYFYELPPVVLKDLVEETLLVHGIEGSERQVGYICEFLRNEASEPRAAKHLLHQFGVAISLSKDARRIISEDQKGVQLQYFFVASFLLTKYSSLFSIVSYSKLLKDIRNLAGAGASGSAEIENYRRTIEQLALSPAVRNKLESIIRYPVTSGNESSPGNFIDVGELIKAIKELKTLV